MNKGARTQLIPCTTTSLTTRAANGRKCCYFYWILQTKLTKEAKTKVCGLLHVWYEILPCMEKGSVCGYSHLGPQSLYLLREKKQIKTKKHLWGNCATDHQQLPHYLAWLSRIQYSTPLMTPVDITTHVTYQVRVEIFICRLQHFNNYCPSGEFHSLALLLSESGKNVMTDSGDCYRQCDFCLTKLDESETLKAELLGKIFKKAGVLG